jgi:hypothetical protein
MEETVVQILEEYGIVTVIEKYVKNEDACEVILDYINNLIDSATRLHQNESENIISLKSGDLGNLKQISDMLWKEMLKEVNHNGHSDLTLSLEGATRGIQDIIYLNKIKEG